MNENEKKVVNEETQTPTPIEEKKEEKKKSFRVRLGEKLLSGEPILPKKVKRGLAIAGGILGTAGALAIGWVAHGGFGGAASDIPELPDGTDEIPFDPDLTTDVVDTIQENVV